MVAPRNFSSASYSPGQVPTDPKEIPRYLSEEFSKIAAVTSQLAAGHLDPTFVEPAKRQAGDFRLADGTHWNPGSGQGFYRYNGTTWVFLG